METPFEEYKPTDASRRLELNPITMPGQPTLSCVESRYPDLVYEVGVGPPKATLPVDAPAVPVKDCGVFRRVRARPRSRCRLVVFVFRYGICLPDFSSILQCFHTRVFSRMVPYYCLRILTVVK